MTTPCRSSIISPISEPSSQLRAQARQFMFDQLIAQFGTGPSEEELKRRIARVEERIFNITESMDEYVERMQKAIVKVCQNVSKQREEPWRRLLQEALQNLSMLSQQNGRDDSGCARARIYIPKANRSARKNLFAPNVVSHPAR